jgi:transposase
MLVSTKTVGGHVDTILPQGSAGRRRRRLHSDEFKANAVAAASRPGVSMAAVAMSVGVNANLLRRWVHDAESKPVKSSDPSKAAVASAVAPSSFLAVQLPAPTASASDIRLELRRGAMTAVVTWPTTAAAECAAWMRELLR